MDTESGRLIEDADGVSVAVLDGGVDGAGAASKATTLSREAAAAHGLSPQLLDELADLAADKVRADGLRLIGEGGLLVELTRHLMQVAVEAEMDRHLAEEAGRTGGWPGLALRGQRPQRLPVQEGHNGGRHRDGAGPQGPAGHLQLRRAAQVRAADRRPGGDGPLAHREGADLRGDRRSPHTPVDAARTLAGTGPDHPGDWMPIERHFRDGHTET